MRIANLIILFAIMIMALTCNTPQSVKSVDFPSELVHFVNYSKNPLFSGTDTNTWDRHIRERGWILREDSVYHLWYTGYIDEKGEKHLGYASSRDGYHWIRDSNNPIYDRGWVEDMCVIKSDSIYYMFAEGRGDTAHMLSSLDRIHWTELGNLDIRQTNGDKIIAGPFGTPTVWKESGTWYLFYERNDLGIWLAKSTDMKIWTNVQDNPVIEMGPEEYDRYAVAMDQVIKYHGWYYGYYHASAFKDWHEWTSDGAISPDLVHWKKYPGNPILKENKSSPILVNDGRRFRLYSMHDKVQVHLPLTDSLPDR
jgi:hypothetical protein